MPVTTISPRSVSGVGLPASCAAPDVPVVLLAEPGAVPAVAESRLAEPDVVLASRNGLWIGRDRIGDLRERRRRHHGDRDNRNARAKKTRRAGDRPR